MGMIANNNEKREWVKELEWVKVKPEPSYYWSEEKGWALKPDTGEYWIIREVRDVYR
jgi:hypothetical protein